MSIVSTISRNNEGRVSFSQTSLW